VPRERSHHFIPEFHLAQFIGLPFRRFLVFDKKWGKVGSRSVASSAVSRDHYLLPGESIDDRLRIERQFAALEDRVAPLIRRLASSGLGAVSLSAEERDALAGYAAILHVRVPATRETALIRARAMGTDPESMGLTDPVAFLRSARRFGLVGSDEELEARRQAWLRDVRLGRRGFDVHPAISLVGLKTAVQKVRPLLIEREWELLRMDRWPGLVLGDQPVTLLSRGRISPEIGFGTDGVQVMMPLSPDILLLISDRPREAVLMNRIEPDRPGLSEPWGGDRQPSRLALVEALGVRQERGSS